MAEIRISEYKMKPSPDQERWLLEQLRLTRECYTHMLDERQEHFRIRTLPTAREKTCELHEAGKIDLVAAIKDAPKGKLKAALRKEGKPRFNAMYALLKETDDGKALMRKIRRENDLYIGMDDYKQKLATRACLLCGVPHNAAYYGISRVLLGSTAERLHLAYVAWLSGRKTGAGKAGKPEVPVPHEWNSLVYSAARDAVSAERQELSLPGGHKACGAIPLMLYRDIPGPYASLTVLKRPSGWYVQLRTAPEPVKLAPTDRKVGIDTGVAFLAVDTDGHVERHPSALANSLDKLRSEQRSLSRKRFHPFLEPPSHATLCVCSGCGEWTDTDPRSRMFVCGFCGSAQRRVRNSRAVSRLFGWFRFTGKRPRSWPPEFPLRRNAPVEEIVRLAKLRIGGGTVHRDDPALCPPPEEEDVIRKSSKRRIRQRQAVARLHERIAQRRKEALHSISRQYVNEYGMIALEALETSKMLSDDKERHLNRSLVDASLSKLRHYIVYKGSDAGREVHANRAAGHTRLCSSCGSLTDTTFKDWRISCPACGLDMMRQSNSARNALQLAEMGIPEGITLSKLSIMYQGWLRTQP